MSPWKVVDPAGKLDIELIPAHDRHSKTDIGVLATEVHQVFGHWSGEVVDDDRRRVDLEGMQGFAEESRSRS